MDSKLFYDAEGYTRSFRQDQEAEYRLFFERYGFAVVECLSAAECERTRDDIWKYIEQKLWVDERFRKPPFPSRGDPETWSKGWPGMANEGIVGSGVVWTAQACENRQHPAVHQVWATLLGTDELLVNLDRYGLFRPTEGAAGLSKLWRTEANVHLDMCTQEYFGQADSKKQRGHIERMRYQFDNEFIIENNFVGVKGDGELHIQGLINLADNRAEDGGFWLVPGFHKYLERFATVDYRRLCASYGSTTFQVLPHELMTSLHPIRICAREGYLVVWDQRVAHGSSPNASPRARYAQFLKLFPASAIHSEDRRAARAVAVGEALQAIPFEPSELGKRIFGLAPYSEPTNESKDDDQIQS
ncbi:MAG: phytanoyl-CoA dioxygenase family protein [archaeon]|nr:phytanoyl-CoA dioxygenase family protein [archaeon]